MSVGLDTQGIKSMVETQTYPAMLWEKKPDNKVYCFLCSWECLISPGKLGRCQVRQNIDGELVSLNYHHICAANIDPIEKKPLFHFMPGSTSFSVACVGCNFQCDFCQNWQISQMPLREHRIDGEAVSPNNLVEIAQRNHCQSISYTYTEPTIFFELAYDTSRRAHEVGIKNIFVSNGYMTPQALETIEPWLDAINVDLKSFREDYYRRVCHGHLEPVLRSLRWLAKSRIWFEVTTLIVPEQNDSEEELRDIARFIAEELGPHVPWHVSRFHPDYKMTGIGGTPTSTVELALAIGKAAGLRYCYGGNIPIHLSESTHCYQCGQTLIERWGFSIRQNKIKDGKCPSCETPVDGVAMDWGV
jgi:pyruvate formate lyase activating enzyme